MFCKVKEKPDFINLSSLECDRICSACTNFSKSDYTKKETINKAKEALKNIEKVHDADCVKWRGKVKDKDFDELYTEIVSEYLCDNFEKLNKYISCDRKYSYKSKDHINLLKGKSKDEAEVQICKNITGKKYDFIGKVLDFEIPISANENDNAGEIDNISYNESTKSLFLLELKKENNENDSMLRALLEVYKYYKKINIYKLIKDFPEISEVKNIFLTPLVFLGSRQFCERPSVRPKLSKLINKMEETNKNIKIKPYFLIKNGPDYKVIDK